MLESKPLIFKVQTRNTYKRQSILLIPIVKSKIEKQKIKSNIVRDLYGIQKRSLRIIDIVIERFVTEKFSITKKKKKNQKRDQRVKKLHL